MFSNLLKIVTKIVSWGIRKLGGGFSSIGSKLESVGIDIKEEPALSTTITSVKEIELIDDYDILSNNDIVPTSLIIETKDKLSRNYLTKCQVYWSYKNDVNPHSEILSIVHDKNISLVEIENKIHDILSEYSVIEEKGQVNIVSVERIAVLHKFGNPY